MTTTAIQNNSPLQQDAGTIGARYIRAKELKRVYGITARVLAMIPDAPKPVRLSQRVVLFSIAELDFYLRRNSGGGVRGTSLRKNKKSDSGIPPGSSVTALDNNTQAKGEKAR